MSTLSSDLYEDIRTDSIILARLRTREGAEEIARALCNMRWEKTSIIPEDELIINKLKGVHGDLWQCSWRTAGGFVAAIRNAQYNTAEDYMDFYCVGHEGFISDFVRTNFRRLGWVPVPYDDL